LALLSRKTSWQAVLLRLSLKISKIFRRDREPEVATMRRRLRLIEGVVPHPPRGTETRTVSVDGIAAVHTKVRDARTDCYILHFHGGGYAFGSAPLYRDFAWRISAATRACVLYFDYRLAPEHPFPAAVEDASRAYRWLADRIDPHRIAFLGDSAGGGLAFATAYKLRDEGFSLPCAIVALSPWTDLALTGESLRSNAKADPIMNVARLPSFANHYLGGANPRHPYASPLYGDVEGLPPILIQVGSDEILRDDSVRMATKLHDAGRDVEIEVWPRMPHAWQLYARILPEGRRAIERVGEFLQDKL